MKLFKSIFFAAPLMVALIIIAATAPASAIDYYLCAGATTVDMPGDPGIPMWGFALDDDNNLSNGCSGPVQVPGPRLIVPPGEGLNIFLRNDLPEPVSIVIPGQEMPVSPGCSGSPVWTDRTRGPRTSAEQRVRSFGCEAASNGGNRSYRWGSGTANPLKPGTYTYHSGTHPQIQVQMGLYGAVSQDFAAGNRAYPGVPYDKSQDLLFSEIDPALHRAVADGTYGTTGPTSALDYNPKFFLINGQPYTAGTPCIEGLNVGDKVLLRMMSAGLREFAPMMIGSHFRVVAEGGNKYQFAETRYSLLLQPGSTKDVIFSPSRIDKYPIIDRRLNLTNAAAPRGGMQTCLMVRAAVQPPISGSSDIMDESDSH